MSISFGGNKGSTSNNSQFSGTGAFNENQNTTGTQASNNNFTGSTAPTNPDWMSALAQHLAGGVSNLSGFDPQSFVAGANPLQTQAAQAAAHLFSGAGGTNPVASTPVPQPSGGISMPTPAQQGLDRATGVPAGALGYSGGKGGLPTIDGVSQPTLNGVPQNTPGWQALVAQQGAGATPGAAHATAPEVAGTSAGPAPGQNFGDWLRASAAANPGAFGNSAVMGGGTGPGGQGGQLPAPGGFTPTGTPTTAGAATPGAIAAPATTGAAYSAAQGLAANSATAPWLPALMAGATPQSTAAQAAATSSVGFNPASGLIKNYMDPALQDEVNNTLAAYDNQAGQRRAQDDLAMAASGAFGGSGAAVQKALTEGQLGLGRGQLEAGLRSNAFNQALGGAENQSGQSLQASEANAANQEQTNLANAAMATQTAQANTAAQLQKLGLSANLGLGEQGQQLAAAQGLSGITGQQGQQSLNDILAQFGIGSGLQGIQQTQAQAPLTTQAFLTQLFSGLPLNLFNGQTQVGNQTGLVNTTGTTNATGTQTQSGTQSGTGNTSGFGFGFKNGGG